MNETRSLGIQCESSKSTGVQTKRLSKEELRYYTKIVEKEKQILLCYVKATREHPVLRQPHYRVNLQPTQTKVQRNNHGTKKKRKTKNNRSKTKGKGIDHGDQENTSHYVSKIVVDDATHCLKLRVRSCNPKKSQELKELNSTPVPLERTRSRKAKQPRRYNRGLESLAELENMDGDMNEVENKSTELESLSSSQQPLKQNRPTVSPKLEYTKPINSIIDENDVNKNQTSPTITTLKTISIKAEVGESSKNTDCLFADKESHDNRSSTHSSPLPTMTSLLPPVPSDENSPASSDSHYQSPHEDSDDNQSVCSEEFFIVETRKDKLVGTKEADESECHDKSNKTNIEHTDMNLKNELKKRLQANINRKSVDDSQYENVNTENGKEAAVSEPTRPRNMPRALPQVVTVHVSDTQTHTQKVNPADAHTPYNAYPMVRDASTLPYAKPLSTTLPYTNSSATAVAYPNASAKTLAYPEISATTLPHTKSSPVTIPYTMSPSATLPKSPTKPLPYHMVPIKTVQKPFSATSIPRHPTLSQASLSRIPPINSSYPPYYTTNAAGNHKQHASYQIPIPPPNTRTFQQEIDGNNKATRGDYAGFIPSQVTSHYLESLESRTTREVASVIIPRALETRTNGVTTNEGSTSVTCAPTDVRSHHIEISSNNSASAAVTPTYPNPKETGNSDVSALDKQGQKRKRFIFGSHEPPKKKVISSLLTPLCEREATRLADGIHEINMQYFPLRSLAQKAANRVSGDTDDVLKLIEQKMQLKTKIQDVEKARNLLKDIYDMVLKSKEIEDIQNFELVSHNFGVRNILNHLSLVDLYFGELGTELQSKI